MHRPVAGLCRRGGRGSRAAAGPAQLRGSCASETGGCVSRGRRPLLQGGTPVGIGRRQESQQWRRLAERGAQADHRDQAPVQHCLPRCHHLRCQSANQPPSKRSNTLNFTLDASDLAPPIYCETSELPEDYCTTCFRACNTKLQTSAVKAVMQNR